MNLHDKVVLITGASSGLGWETALLFAKKRAHVAVAARSVSQLQQLSEIIQERGDSCFVVPTDLTDVESVNRMVQQTIAHYGRLDILINNAGFAIFDSFQDAELKDLEAMMNVNYFGTVRTLKAVFPHMIERGSGTIVNIASIAGFIATPTHGGYAASKFAVIGLSESLRYELQNTGVRIITINPGPIDTPFFDRAGRSKLPQFAERFFLRPEQVAKEIVQAVEKGKKRVFLPKYFSLFVKLKHLFPGLFERVSSRL